jgi:hypothetical protein
MAKETTGAEADDVRSVEDKIMAIPPALQTTLVQSAAYASLLLQMMDRLFPETRYLALSDDQRRIAHNETDNLLTRSKYRIESKGFAGTFGYQQDPRNIAPADTVLGAPPVEDRQQKLPGQYV